MYRVILQHNGNSWETDNPTSQHKKIRVAITKHRDTYYSERISKYLPRCYDSPSLFALYQVSQLIDTWLPSQAWRSLLHFPVCISFRNPTEDFHACSGALQSINSVTLASLPLSVQIPCVANPCIYYFPICQPSPLLGASSLLLSALMLLPTYVYVVF